MTEDHEISKCVRTPFQRFSELAFNIDTSRLASISAAPQVRGERNPSSHETGDTGAIRGENVLHLPRTEHNNKGDQASKSPCGSKRLRRHSFGLSLSGSAPESAPMASAQGKSDASHQPPKCGSQNIRRSGSLTVSFRQAIRLRHYHVGIQRQMGPPNFGKPLDRSNSSNPLVQRRACPKRGSMLVSASTLYSKRDSSGTRQTPPSSTSSNTPITIYIGHRGHS